jgi:hypothetical protein
VAITFDKALKTILVEAPAASVSVQELDNAIRDYEPTQGMMDYPPIALASGKEDLGGGLYVGITLELLDDWRVQFEARTGPAWTPCRISGGNLVAFNSFGDDPVKPSAFTYVTRALSTSAALLSGGGGALTAQETCDAVMKLAPTVGVPAAGSLEETATSILFDAEVLRKIETGRWQIVGNQMIFYDTNGVDELLVFDLTDQHGSPTMENVFQRRPA